MLRLQIDRLAAASPPRSWVIVLPSPATDSTETTTAFELAPNPPSSIPITMKTTTKTPSAGTSLATANMHLRTGHRTRPLRRAYKWPVNPHQNESLHELGINTNGQTTFWPRHSPYPKTFGLAQSIEKIIHANELREWASGSEMGHG
jgi:hypothetical protein